jgi:hypothetical protein
MLWREDRRPSDAGHPRDRSERDIVSRSRHDAAALPPPPPAGGAAAPKPKFEHRAFLVGIDGGTSWLDRSQLTRHFSKFGQVVDVFTPKGKQVAYVAFENQLELQAALEAEQHVVTGCTVRVSRAEKV